MSGFKDLPIDVSVLTPSFNYARFIRDAVESVASQSGIEVEHVIQDGGSTDHTQHVLAELERAGLYWTSERDEGQSEALNRALSRAKGRFIAWLNADEFYLPGGLRAMYDCAVRSGADVVYADAVFVDEHARFIRLLPQHRFSGWLLRWYECYIQTCALLIKREALAQAPWDPRMRRMMDWDLFLRLERSGARFAHVPYPVGAFRVHPGQVIAAPASQHRDEYVRLASEYGVRTHGQRLLGRFVHGVEKIRSGSYQRQVAARHLRGKTMRWFAEGEGQETMIAFFRKCYPDEDLPLGA